MNLCKTRLLALAFAAAAAVATASDDFAGRDPRVSHEANSVDGTGTFSVNPRLPGSSGETVGPDPSDMATGTPASDGRVVTDPAIANPYAWSVDEVYLPTPRSQANAASLGEQPLAQR